MKVVAVGNRTSGPDCSVEVVDTTVITRGCAQLRQKTQAEKNRKAHLIVPMQLVGRNSEAYRAEKSSATIGRRY
jgi:hypothetical protein